MQPTTNEPTSPTQTPTQIPTQPIHNVSCGSFIENSLVFIGEKHYYLFENEHDELDITISTCLNGYYSTFDTDLTIYDADMTQLAFVDDGCSSHRALLSQVWSEGRYLIMLDAWNYYSIGEYFIEFSCILPTPSPTAMSIMTSNVEIIDQSMEIELEIENLATCASSTCDIMTIGEDNDALFSLFYDNPTQLLYLKIYDECLKIPNAELLNDDLTHTLYTGSSLY